MPQEMRDLFTSTIPAMLQTDSGNTAFKSAFDIDEVLPVNDAYYEDFREFVDESLIELATLVK